MEAIEIPKLLEQFGARHYKSIRGREANRFKLWFASEGGPESWFGGIDAEFRFDSLEKALLENSDSTSGAWCSFNTIEELERLLRGEQQPEWYLNDESEPAGSK